MCIKGKRSHLPYCATISAIASSPLCIKGKRSLYVIRQSIKLLSEGR
ncbi:hypothetical protein H6F66_26020 [Trichocoleus sp. FACHB-6]|nr:hypothetical protein [Trichocoleus sp. FACHB-6]